MKSSDARRPRTAVVIGGSMGGLFIGNMLHRQGWDVTIFERAAEPLAQRGAGIAGHPELSPILRACGIDRDRINGVDVAGRSAYDATGRPLAYFAHPQYLTYWGLLHDTLRAAFPADRYRAGIGLEHLVPGTPQTTVTLSDGREIRADLVVAADGVRSRARALLAPHVQPRYAGYFAFRGMVPERDLSQAFRDTLFHRYVWIFPGDGQLNGYPICGPDYATAPGRRQYAYLWYRRVDEATMRDLLTDAHGHHHGVNIPPPLIRPEHFARLKRHAATLMPPLFAEIVTRAQGDMLQPMYDVVSSRMVFANIALLGDAAFVARPHVGTGVLKAGQDAMALAHALAADNDLPSALAAYERTRLEPCLRSVLFSRHLGSFIEHGRPTPYADPARGLTPADLIALSARPVETTAPDFPIGTGAPEVSVFP